MRIVKPLVIVETDLSLPLPNGMTMAQHLAKKIEIYTRRCYKSEGKMTDTSYLKFLEGVYQGKFHSGIADHAMVSISFVTDRGVGEEGVRHRMAAPYLEEDQQVTLAEGSMVSFLKESTRYCDYTPEGEKAKGMTFILPPWVKPMKIGSLHQFVHDDIPTLDWKEWLSTKRSQEETYNRLRTKGWRPEQARAELVLGLKTEYVMSAPLSSWWNWCQKRAAVFAHPQMRQLAIPVLRYFQFHFPQFFSNIPLPSSQEVLAGREAFSAPALFEHKGEWYEEARLVVNPFYDQVQLDEVYSD